MRDLRIPIREWSKTCDSVWKTDRWRLSVEINGVTLDVGVEIHPDARLPRDYIIRDAARLVGEAVAKEIRKTLS